MGKIITSRCTHSITCFNETNNIMRVPPEHKKLVSKSGEYFMILTFLAKQWRINIFLLFAALTRFCFHKLNFIR